VRGVRGGCGVPPNQTKPLHQTANFCQVERAKQPTIAIICSQYHEKTALDQLMTNRQTFVRYATVGKEANRFSVRVGPMLLTRLVSFIAFLSPLKFPKGLLQVTVQTSPIFARQITKLVRSHFKLIVICLFFGTHQCGRHSGYFHTAIPDRN
jgi:hypothetical protein